MSPNDLLLFCLAISMFTALLYLFLGYHIAIKQKQDWINGVDFTKLSNPVEFTKAIGKSMLNGGFVMIAASILLYADIIEYLLFSLILCIACSFPIVSFFRSKTKYA